MNTTQVNTEFSRVDYLNSKCTHRQYYAQFVNPTIKSRVLNRFSIKQLTDAVNSENGLNSLPLAAWGTIACNLYDVSPKLKAAGDYLTLAGGVCIAKEAAKQIVESVSL